MKNNIDEQATHLIEGSVWQNRRGKTYTVLFIANLTVSHKMSSRLVPSVTFINADGAVFNLDCDSFLRAYSYVEDNDLMASCIEQVYKCNAGDLESSTDAFIDELEQEVGYEEPEVEQPQHEQLTEQSEAKQSRTLAEQIVKPFVIDFVTEGQPKLTNEELASAFEGYSSYMDSRGVVFHKIYFVPQGSVVAYTLNQTFNPTVDGDEYDLIHLNTGCTDFDIKWNAFGYIGAEIINGKEYLVVVLADEPEDMLDSDEVTEPVVESSEQPSEQSVQEEYEEPIVSSNEEQDDLQDDGSSVELVNVETVDQDSEQDNEQLQPQQADDTAIPDHPSVIAHLADPLDGKVIHVHVQADGSSNVEPLVEQPVEINVDDVVVEQHGSEQQQDIDNYFDVIDITDAQAQQVAEQVTKA